MNPPARFLLALSSIVMLARADAALFEMEKPKPIVWTEVKRQPATVVVENARPEQLVVGNGNEAWAKIPENLKRLAAVVQMPAQKHLGVAQYRITAGGWLVIACNWSYQGNSGGDWKNESLSEADLMARGWRKLSESELGGQLVKGDGRVQTVFIKKVAKGEEGRLRCNKYDPPYLIVGSAAAGE